MTLSSSVPQTTREEVYYIETVYADRVENVYGDRVGKAYTDRFAPNQPSRETDRTSYVARDGAVIYCDSGHDCIRPCGVATCAVWLFTSPRRPRTKRGDPAQKRRE